MERAFGSCEWSRVRVADKWGRGLVGSGCRGSLRTRSLREQINTVRTWTHLPPTHLLSFSLSLSVSVFISCRFSLCFHLFYISLCTLLEKRNERKSHAVSANLIFPQVVATRQRFGSRQKSSIVQCDTVVNIFKLFYEWCIYCYIVV